MKRLEALPAWLRWALFLPVGLAFHFILAFVLESVLAAAGLRPGRGTPNAVTMLAVTQFVSGLTFTLFPAVLAPSPRPVALVLFALGVLSDVVPIGYSYANYEYQRSRLPLAAAMAAVEAVGGLLAVWRVRLLPPRTAPS